MIYKRKIPINIYSKVQSYSQLALKKVSGNNGINPTQLNLLIILNTLQKEHNQYISINLIKERSAYTNPVIYNSLNILKKQQLIEKVKNMYSVTTAGNYLVMSFNTEIARMTLNSQLSHWKKLLAQHNVNEETKDILDVLCS